MSTPGDSDADHDRHQHRWAADHGRKESRDHRDHAERQDRLHRQHCGQHGDPITTATNTAGPPIPVGRFPDAIAITPNDKTAYVANHDSDTVTPISTVTNTAGPPIAVGNGPDAIAIATLTTRHWHRHPTSSR